MRLTHAGLETFPRDNPDFSKENFFEGWSLLLGKRLREFLEAPTGRSAGRSTNPMKA